MKNISVNRELCGDIARTLVTSGLLMAQHLKVGSRSKITVTGRGNVRQIKAMTRGLAKV